MIPHFDRADYQKIVAGCYNTKVLWASGHMHIHRRSSYLRSIKAISVDPLTTSGRDPLRQGCGFLRGPFLRRASTRALPMCGCAPLEQRRFDCRRARSERPRRRQALDVPPRRAGLRLVTARRAVAAGRGSDQRGPARPGRSATETRTDQRDHSYRVRRLYRKADCDRTKRGSLLSRNHSKARRTTGHL
jgi:hypothetical protein